MLSEQQAKRIVAKAMLLELLQAHGGVDGGHTTALVKVLRDDTRAPSALELEANVHQKRKELMKVVLELARKEVLAIAEGKSATATNQEDACWTS